MGLWCSFLFLISLVESFLTIFCPASTGLFLRFQWDHGESVASSGVCPWTVGPWLVCLPRNQWVMSARYSFRGKMISQQQPLKQIPGNCSWLPAPKDCICSLQKAFVRGLWDMESIAAALEWPGSFLSQPCPSPAWCPGWGLCLGYFIVESIGT